MDIAKGLSPRAKVSAFTGMVPIIALQERDQFVVVWKCRSCDLVMCWNFAAGSVFDRVFSGEIPIEDLTAEHNDAYRYRNCMISGWCPDCCHNPTNREAIRRFREAQRSALTPPRAHDIQSKYLKECADDEL